MRQSISAILFLFGFLFSKIEFVTANDGEDADFALAGYLPDYRIRSYLFPQVNKEHKISTKSPLTDLIMFSLQPHPRGFFTCCLEQDHYELVEEFVSSTVSSPFSSSPTVRVWVTLGGGGRTEAFPEICADSKLRQRLIGSVMTIKSKSSFIGGIDLDFFQPRSKEELENYVLFLTEAIPQWHHQGLKVSLTLHPGQGKYIPAKVYELLDRIHFMTYDMIGASGSNEYHAKLSKVRGAVQELLQQPVASTKVLLGIPAYSRHLSNPGQVATFGEIYDGIQRHSVPNQETQQFLRGDTNGSLHSLNGYEWESPTRIRAKVDLAKELKLGGIFFWELGQDKAIKEHPRGILLEAASAAIGDDSSKNLGTDEL